MVWIYSAHRVGPSPAFQPTVFCMFILPNEKFTPVYQGCFISYHGASCVANKSNHGFHGYNRCQDIRPTKQYARDCKYRSSKLGDHGKND